MNEIDIFKPGLAELQKLADRVKHLTITGVNDVAGYDAVKAGKKELAEMRILITKFGKSKRDEAIAWQKEVLRQEKQHLAIIEPVEAELKAKMEAIDREKERQARVILLPARKAMLAEISAQMSDDDILAMDENTFSNFYANTKMIWLEANERKRREVEAEQARAEELERAKAEAAEKAVEEERLRVAREQAEADRQAAIQRAEEHEAAKKAEKNKAYKEWLAKNGATAHTLSTGDMKVERNGDTFTLYKLVDTITIR